MQNGGLSFAALLLLAVAISVHADPNCTSLTDNILTSVGCPSACSQLKSPCVLYSPTQAGKCVITDKAGNCSIDESFQVPEATTTTITTCAVQYQCLDSLVDKGRWTLNLDVGNSALTTAAVTRVEQLSYPSDAQIVQFGGGTFESKVHTLKLDNSLFKVPTTVTTLFVTDVDLSGLSDTSKYSIPSHLQYIGFSNTNLQFVPSQFANLTQPQMIQLSKNQISSFLESATDPLLPVFQKITALNLSGNALKTFTPNLTALVQLDLSNNALTKIPDVVFSMAKLELFSMRRSGMSNPQVSAAQYDFLNKLQTLNVDFAVSACPKGYGSKQFSSSSASICVEGYKSSTSSSSKLPIILGVVGAVVIVAAIVGFVWYRRRQSGAPLFATRDSELKPATETKYDTGYEAFSEAESTSAIWSDADLQAARIDFRDVEPLSLLSRGGFGEVWLGEYMGQKVAIKRLLTDKRKMSDVLAFAQEIKTMARLDHPKIVQFIGVCWSNAQNIQAVTEYMDCGDLRALLDSPKAASLTWANLKCQIAIDIADALVYLHTLDPKLIHRDLKSRNVLIDASTGAKLSDFGISRNRSVEETMTAGVGTARWIAPEVILGGHYTEFADIYSFGVVLSELDTGKTPFYDATNTNGGRMQDVTILQLVSAGKLQPSFTPQCPRSIATLAQACLSFAPAQRPSAIHITYELRKILKEEF